MFRASTRATRWYSTRAIPPKPRVRDLLRTPVFKSMILTIVLGTVVVDVMKGKRELESLQNNHISKMGILREVIDKLKKGDKVDLARELKLANTLSDTSDIEIDESIEAFFKMADEPEKEQIKQEQFKEQAIEPEATERRRIETSKFL